jgi:hypothetical protein
VVISHDMASVFRIADRISMLHQRRILATGTVAEILAHEDPYLYEFIRTSGVAAAGAGDSDGAQAADRQGAMKAVGRRQGRHPRHPDGGGLVHRVEEPRVRSGRLAGAYSLWAKLPRRLGPADRLQGGGGRPPGRRDHRPGHRRALPPRSRFKLRGSVAVWDSGVVVKKAVSLLGDHYLEIDPGSAQSIGADGIAEDHQQLVAGAQIERVVEATSVDQLLRRIEETLPNVDSVLAVGARTWPTTSAASSTARSPRSRAKVDSLVQREADTVSSILAKRRPIDDPDRADHP